MKGARQDIGLTSLPLPSSTFCSTFYLSYHPSVTSSLGDCEMVLSVLRGKIANLKGTISRNIFINYILTGSIIKNNKY